MWLHDATSSDTGGVTGQTRLSFECGDVARLTARMVEAGHEAVFIDESYGRSLRLVDPLGETLVINEHSDDTYGYTTSAPAPDERLAVTPVRFTDPQGAYGSFLTALGLRLRGAADAWYAAYDSGDGLVGLHHDDSKAPIVPGDGACHLTFETHEDLDDLAARLVVAGYDDAHVERDEFVSLVAVTDPDGQLVQIHAG